MLDFEIMMSAVAYKWITTVCFVVGAAAVLMFDRFQELHWLLGSLVVLSTVVATALHLWTQQRMNAAIEHSSHAAEKRGDFELQNITHVVATLQCEYLNGFTEFRLRNPLTAAVCEMPAKRIVISGLRPVQRFTQDDLEMLATLARRLSPHRTDYEISLTADGKLSIRTISRFVDLAEDRPAPLQANPHPVLVN